MKAMGRRTFLKSSTAGLFLAPAIMKASTPRSTDMRIESITTEYQPYKYRVPIKFGGLVTDSIVILNVHCTATSKGGKTAKGFGSMPLANSWAFPSRKMSYDVTFGAMKALSERIAKLTGDYKEYGHPIDLTWALEPSYLKAADEVTRQQKLVEPIPKLCTLVTASAYDAALHDAYGKMHNLNCYHTYGPEFMNHDLAYYVGNLDTENYKGQYPQDYIRKEPKARMPMYHLVSAIDPLVEADITHHANDGLPETLPQWINYNGLTHFKIKLDGDDLKWDSERVLRTDSVVTEAEKKRGTKDWVYSLDFNERCPNVQYLVDFLNMVKAKSPGGFERIQYVEQPTARDLATHRQQVVFAAAKIKPVVIDESLTGLDALMLSRQMGYSGVALKACKGQSSMMIIGSVAERHKMFICVQDLTCPGASLIQSASLSAHVPDAKAIEANSCQYVPAANAGWDKRFPGIFIVKDGTMDTSHLNGVGLGAEPAGY